MRGFANQISALVECWLEDIDNAEYTAEAFHKMIPFGSGMDRVMYHMMGILCAKKMIKYERVLSMEETRAIASSFQSSPQFNILARQGKSRNGNKKKKKGRGKKRR